MPRFFFDILGGEGETTDDVGQEFPDARTAFDAAVDVLSEVAKEVKPDNYSAQYSCTVKNSEGLALFRCTLSVIGELLTQDLTAGQDSKSAYEGRG
jgi:hypothetical protein